ncbi:sterol-binding protein [Thiohalocapsa marina]|uniref:Ubiquinone biosynthesis accessory factor UbiT n=1 Tax=Thiohalocapsa marina TaxID=424902 RepID=A0A5M8FQ46_9GAMM|nr:SCP2 sterol-binding domain-containing protein [Thiohalocapsa marina]KAA6186644.1 sterol-binding protein [Thiohalocapsa marina]
MSPASQDLSRSPTLPRLLTLPLGFVPSRLNSAVLAQILNRVFKAELADGELDFLDQRIMLIRVLDARLSYRLTLRNGRLQAAAPVHRPAGHPAAGGPVRDEDLSIEGNTYEFLLLATRREDPDTLFFNRRLRLGGDTELGLYTKNFLDGLELEQRLGPLLNVLNQMTDMLGRLGSGPIGRPARRG